MIRFIDLQFFSDFDINGDTDGYNIQATFPTAKLAAKSYK